MYADTLKYFVKVIKEKAIGHVLRVVAVLLDVSLCLFAHKFFLR
jgi:hypothetical protein